MAAVRRLLSATALVTAAALSYPAVAHADAYPYTPRNAHVSALTSSSITVTSDPSQNALTYRLYLSTDQSDVWWANIVAGTHTSALRTASSSKPSLTISGIPYSGATWYWRLEAINGSQYSMSGFYTTGLRPATPSGLTGHADSHGTWLTWGGAEAGGYNIQRADNSAMTTNVRSYTDTTAVRQFTPADLVKGHPYWMRVQAVNTGITSPWTTPVLVTPTVDMQSVKVLTYNLLQLVSDGSSMNGNVISAWSQRRLVQAQVIKSTGADILMVQEGGPWVGAGPQSWSSMAGAVRQVDSLQSALAGIGANYTVAHTEALWGQTGFAKNWNYILYNPANYAPVGNGGDWQIGDQIANAAWQVLKNRQTGAKIMVVCTHLIPDNGETADLARERETNTMLGYAQAKAASLGIPVIYGGDFNSSPGIGLHPIDGPNVAMRAAGIADQHGAAQYKWNATLDTETSYARTPHWYAYDIDYLFLSPGVAARTWGVDAALQNGSWPGTIPSDHNAVDGTIAFPY